MNSVKNSLIHPYPELIVLKMKLKEFCLILKKKQLFKILIYQEKKIIYFIITIAFNSNVIKSFPIYQNIEKFKLNLALLFFLALQVNNTKQ